MTAAGGLRWRPFQIFCLLLLLSQVRGSSFWHLAGIRSDASAGASVWTTFHALALTSVISVPATAPLVSAVPACQLALALTICADAPLVLVESALKHMVRVVLFLISLRAQIAVEPKPDFVLWSGDTGSHPSSVTAEAAAATLFNVSVQLRDAFPDVRVFPAIGSMPMLLDLMK
jgi:hypothetical protein